jgi:hypothetical protein
MPETDSVLAAYIGRHGRERVFVRGEIGARVLLGVEPQRLYFRFEGEADGAQIIDAIRDATAAGLLTSDDFSALVDMSTFTGVLDWKVIPQISEVMPQGDTATNKNAYVVRDSLTAVLAKINSALFSKTQHRAFSHADEALAWLGWDE